MEALRAASRANAALLRKVRARERDARWTADDALRMSAMLKHVLALYVGILFGMYGAYGFDWTMWGSALVNGLAFWMLNSGCEMDLESIGESQRFVLDGFVSSYGLMILTWCGVSAALGRPWFTSEERFPRSFPAFFVH
ncbi:unnamed product [Ostreococcus tauri]|uniref:Unnamed product n=1 Tax=Ostreococcus tauri TaxID=70448 RepID=A0A090M138_OSTTA|nr:unnamed product [Ostreococcus tauri]CEF97881.1 unnamed product [Ostreococcus tauri]|eukprot:XP_022838946.1 unnamed product [Ostreococcus tauri]